MATKHLTIILTVAIVASATFLCLGGSPAGAASFGAVPYRTDGVGPASGIAVPAGPAAGGYEQAAPLSGEGQEGWGVGSVRVWAGVRVPGGIAPEAGVCFETGSARTCTDASGWGQIFLSSSFTGEKYYDIGLLRQPGTSRYICRIQRPTDAWDQEIPFGLWEPVHAKILVTGSTAVRFVCIRLPEETP